MHRTQIQLPADRVAALKRLAAVQGVSMAELIRRGVDTLLASQPLLSTAERRRRAMAIAGRFRAGKRFSARHDAEFAAAISRR